MGHFSNVECIGANTSISQIDSEITIKKRIKNLPELNCQTQLSDTSKLNCLNENETSLLPKNNKFQYEYKYNINLDEYTKNFKGDNVLGYQFKAPLKWDKIIMIFSFYIVAVVALLIFPLDQVLFKSVLWAFFMGVLGGFGVTGGAHRYWTHRAFKANLPLRIIMMLCFTCSGQNNLFEWVRDHRVHHKYSETDADPHNSNRGFFFSHVGWLMMYKHPEVLKRGRQIDMSDILADPVIRFHIKYFIPLKILLCFLLPTLVPIYLWNDIPLYAFASQCIYRYLLSLNFTWSVNSAAHMWGTRPYDKRINPTENIIVSIVALGEGWHNYHHVFPWDYKAAELGKYSLNITTMILDGFHKIGWCWDLKQPSKELVQRTYEKYGDGNHSLKSNQLNGNTYIPEIPHPDTSKCHDIDDDESSGTESTKLDDHYHVLF